MLEAAYFAGMKTQLWFSEVDLHLDKITLPPATDKHLPDKGFFIWFFWKKKKTNSKNVECHFEYLRSAQLSSKNEEIDIFLLPFATKPVL